jgi:hypothetical protein
MGSKNAKGGASLALIRVSNGVGCCVLLVVAVQSCWTIRSHCWAVCFSGGGAACGGACGCGSCWTNRCCPASTRADESVDTTDDGSCSGGTGGVNNQAARVANRPVRTKKTPYRVPQTATRALLVVHEALVVDKEKGGPYVSFLHFSLGGTHAIVACCCCC